jgi:CRP-like cAMP-binding protein
MILRGRDLDDAVPFICICDGWAASFVMLPDGSRQIDAILLPGDIVSTTLLFDARPGCSVEAITAVRYRTFKRSELKELLLQHPHLLENLSKAWVEEKARAVELIVDLGRRSAEERIARLVLRLKERLAQRGKLHLEATEMEFPLRQHHIADVTGLTPSHVSTILSGFRRKRLIMIRRRRLSILDPAGLRRAANL